MIVLLAIAGWSVFALTWGLITGDPFLRTGSVGVLCLTVGAAWLLDRLTPRREEPEVGEWGDECDYVIFEWPNPEQREERAA